MERRALVEAAGGEIVDAHLACWLNIDGPPQGDPTVALIWAQQVALVALDQVRRDPVMSFEKKTFWITKLTDVIGRTHSKTLLEHKLEKLTKWIEGKEDRSGGTQPLGGEPEADSTVSRGVIAGPRLVPSRGTPLRRLWESKGRIPADLKEVVEVPQSSRLYEQWLKREDPAELAQFQDPPTPDRPRPAPALRTVAASVNSDDDAEDDEPAEPAEEIDDDQT